MSNLWLFIFFDKWLCFKQSCPAALAVSPFLLQLTGESRCVRDILLAIITDVSSAWYRKKQLQMLSHALTDMDQELSALIDDAVRANMTQDEIKRLLGIDRRKTRREKVIFWIITICAALALVFAVMLGNCEIGGGFLRDLQDEFCLIDHTLSSLEVSRPIANCSMCQGLTSVPSVANISQQDFRTYHAYTGVPLVVTKATRKWTAFKVFDFKFLKRLYNMSQNDVSGEVNEGCQFFPYRTNFKSLKEVFEMSDRRAALREDQWYVGW